MLAKLNDEPYNCATARYLLVTDCATKGATGRIRNSAALSSKVIR